MKVEDLFDLVHRNVNNGKTAKENLGGF